MVRYPSPACVFKDAIEQTHCLKFREGLSVVKRGEGHNTITAKDNRDLLGGACIDDDCKPAEPHASRWDYVLGYNSSNQTLAFFVEEHGASSHNVSEMEKKLDWLEAFLNRPPNQALSGLARKYYWVQHGKYRIPEHTPQYKRLVWLRNKRKLNGPVPRLCLS